MIELLIASFLAGILTILAPCIVSAIPILLARGGTVKNSRNAFFVIIGLSLSILIFTVLLKATSLFLGIPPEIWRVVSGGIISLFGVITLFPELWEAFVLKTRLVFKAQDTLGKANRQGGPWGDVLLGASLGPVFSACSPTYALIVAVILPAQPLTGLVYLTAFILGLAVMLSLIALLGNSLLKKLGWSLNPKGIFRRVLGIILIIIGVFIVFGIDKTFLGILVENGWYDFQIAIESWLSP
ncbi:MAG: cytochrome c biogenesis protein CcdA [Candidatus Microsaccharimonas sp.]